MDRTHGHGDAAALRNDWGDVLRSDPFIHAALMGSIVAATFQGWLKDRIPGLGPYLLGDALLILAFLWWTAGMATRHFAFSGPRAVTARIIALVAVPTLYVILPGTPLVIEAAGLRTWSAFPIAALIAMSVMRTPGQVRAYLALILGLCLVTALYGIWQYRVGPSAVLDVSDLAQERHGSTVFFAITGGGARQFRAISTFTYPAPFAGMMVFGMTLAAGIVASRHTSTRARLVALGLLPLLFVAMTVSGTRAALVNLGFALIILGWYRGVSLRMLLLLAPVLAGLHVAAILSAGTILLRYRSLLLEEGLLWRYVWAPISIAWRALQANPFGLGLGRSGVGVPYFIVAEQPSGFIVGGDGDIARAAVEMGLIGLLLLAVILLGVLPSAIRAVRDLSRGREDDLALGIGALLGSTGLTILIGSPLSGSPHALIWWLLLGSLVKLHTMAERPPEPPERDGLNP